METCISFMNDVLFCVSYNLAGFTYSVKEKNQSILELLWYNSRWKGRNCISISVKRLITKEGKGRTGDQ